MKKPIFKGAATALITPFRNGAVDYEALGAIIDSQLEAGIDALVVCGTTGEAATMTDNEQIDTIAFAVRRVAGRVPVIAGAGSNNTAHAVELCRASCAVGADALLVVTPYYNKTSQQGLVRMYTEIADSAEKPLILYNVPSRTGVNIEPATYAALAGHPNIAGIKEASGNFSKIAETVHLVGDKLALYCGNDDQTVPMLALGACGVISVLSNIVPADVKKLCTLIKTGNTEEAFALQDKLHPLAQACFVEVNPIPAKAALNLLGLNAGTPRAPLTEIEDANKAKLCAAMREYGLEIKE